MFDIFFFCRKLVMTKPSKMSWESRQWMEIYKFFCVKSHNIVICKYYFVRISQISYIPLISRRKTNERIRALCKSLDQQCKFNRSIHNGRTFLLAIYHWNVNPSSPWKNVRFDHIRNPSIFFILVISRKILATLWKIGRA